MYVLKAGCRFIIISLVISTGHFFSFTRIVLSLIVLFLYMYLLILMVVLADLYKVQFLACTLFALR